MTAESRPVLVRRGLRLEYLTVGWNVVEGIVAVTAGIAAGSIALVGFGIDSGVESVSGAVLVWRLRSEASGVGSDEAIERIERRAERLVGISFLLLAAYVAFEAAQTLLGRDEPETSLVGMGLTALSILVMLWLARAKRETGKALGSRALIADLSRPTPAGICRLRRSRV